MALGLNTLIDYQKPRTRTRTARHQQPQGVMQAAVVTGPQQIEIREMPIPRIRPDEVLIKIQGCGVCPADLPIWQEGSLAGRTLQPGQPGHEAWGRIAGVGDKVRGLRPGDRVTMFSDRAFAEYDVAPAKHVVRLPDALDGEHFPGEALARAMNVFDRSGIEAGQVVAIVGVGFLGAILTALAVQEGAEVIAISRRQFAQDIARRCGADHVMPFGDTEQIVSDVMQLTGGAGCDCVIEATGLADPLDLAGELTRNRGRLVIAGHHQHGLRCINMDLWYRRGLDVINANEPDQAACITGMRTAAVTLACGNLTLAPLFTHTFSLHELPEAMELLVERPHGFLKSVITMESNGF